MEHYIALRRNAGGRTPSVLYMNFRRTRTRTHATTHPRSPLSLARQATTHPYIFHIIYDCISQARANLARLRIESECCHAVSTTARKRKAKSRKIQPATRPPPPPPPPMRQPHVRILARITPLIDDTYVMRCVRVPAPLRPPVVAVRVLVFVRCRGFLRPNAREMNYSGAERCVCDSPLPGTGIYKSRGEPRCVHGNGNVIHMRAHICEL